MALKLDLRDAWLHDTRPGLAGEPPGAITQSRSTNTYQTTFPGLCIFDVLAAAGSVGGEQVFSGGLNEEMTRIDDRGLSRAIISKAAAAHCGRMDVWTLTWPVAKNSQRGINRPPLYVASSPLLTKRLTNS